MAYLTKTFLTSFTIFWFAIAFSQNNSDVKNKITLNGILKNIPDSISNIYFIYSGNNNTDSTPVIGNKYVYEINSTDNPCFITLFSKSPKLPESYKGKYMAILLLDGKNVTITSIDSFSNFQVSGSKAYNEFIKLERMREPYSQQLVRFLKEQEQKRSKSDKEGINNIQIKIDSLHQNISDQYLEYVRLNPSSPTAIYALSKILDFSRNDRDKYIPQVKELYESQSTAEKNTSFGKSIKNRIYDETLSIGKMAINFTLPDTANRSVSLALYNGRYLLLDFWASWCTPCREENKYILQAWNQYKNENFAVLSVSIDEIESKDKWLGIIRKDRLSWDQVIDKDGKVKKMYNVTSIPKNFLIDPTGKIVDKNLRGERLEKVLSKIFN